MASVHKRPTSAPFHCFLTSALCLNPLTNCSSTLQVHCHPIHWFLFAPFYSGRNDGGRKSFQAKHTQQVSCLLIIVVYIVLCSELYTTAPESLASLERSSEQDNSRSIRELRKPVLISMKLPYISGANLSFTAISSERWRGNQDRAEALCAC